MDDAQQAQARAVAPASAWTRCWARQRPAWQPAERVGRAPVAAGRTGRRPGPPATLATGPACRGPAPHSFGGVVREMAILAARARRPGAGGPGGRGRPAALNSQTLVTSHRRAEGLLHQYASLHWPAGRAGSPLWRGCWRPWTRRADHAAPVAGPRRACAALVRGNAPGLDAGSLETARRASRLLADLPEAGLPLSGAPASGVGAAAEVTGAPPPRSRPRWRGPDDAARLARATQVRPAAGCRLGWPQHCAGPAWRLGRPATAPRFFEAVQRVRAVLTFAADGRVCKTQPTQTRWSGCPCCPRREPPWPDRWPQTARSPAAPLPLGSPVAKPRHPDPADGRGGGGQVCKTFTWAQVGRDWRIAAFLKAKGEAEGPGPWRRKVAILSKNCAWWLDDRPGHLDGWLCVGAALPDAGRSRRSIRILTHSESRFIFVGKLDDWDHMKPGVPAVCPG